MILNIENKKINILIVEDNLDFVFFIRKILSDINYEISHISSGVEAFEYLSDHKNNPDIILLDYKLPGLNGIEILNKLIPERDDLSFIFITTDSSIETVIAAMKAGALDFIVKSNALKDELPEKVEKIYKIHKTKLENRKNEIQLRKISEENMLLSTVVEQNSAAIVITDVEGNIEYVNPQFTVISGYTAQEAIGQNPRILKSDYFEDGYYAYMWEAINNGNTWKGVFRNKHKNGSLYWEESIITPILNENKEIKKFVAIKQDITKRKLGEEKIREQNKELSRLNEDKNIFMSILAHDLKNPFGSFVSLLEYITESYDTINSGSIKKMLESIFKSAQNTYSLLIDLLYWARSESGKLPFNPQKLDFSELIFEMFGLFQLQAAKKNILLRNLSENDLTIYGDVNLLKTVVRNLMSNALKFTPSGGTVSIEVKNIGNEHCIIISDSGIGMSNEQLKNLYNINKENSSVGTDNEKGTGFGLVLCKQFVDIHKGRIDVESTKGKGTSFKVFLPQNQ